MQGLHHANVSWIHWSPMLYDVNTLDLSSSSTGRSLKSTFEGYLFGELAVTSKFIGLLFVIRTSWKVFTLASKGVGKIN